MVYDRGVDQFLEKVHMPSGKEDIIVLQYEKPMGEETLVKTLTHRQEVYVAQKLSEQIFPKGDFRYTLLTLEKAYRLCKGKGKSSEFLRGMMAKGPLTAREVILPEEGKIMSDPVVFEHNGRYLYARGNEISVDVNRESIIDTLKNAGLFYKRLKPKADGRFYPDFAEASIRYCWPHDIHLHEPWDPAIHTVLMKTDEKKPEIDPMKITQAEYMDLKRDAQKYRDLKSKIAKIDELKKKSQEIDTEIMNIIHPRGSHCLGPDFRDLMGHRGRSDYLKRLMRELDLDDDEDY